jgi:hypothetical protein
VTNTNLRKAIEEVLYEKAKDLTDVQHIKLADRLTTLFKSTMEEIIGRDRPRHAVNVIEERKKQRQRLEEMMK